MKQRFDEALDQIRYADELGFDTVWAVEHHFLPGYSHLSCPEQFLAAAAMVTKRIRLGHSIMHVPFKINHPFRVAEHIGTLDVLSGGRVEFGAGRATSQEGIIRFRGGSDRDAATMGRGTASTAKNVDAASIRRLGE